MVRTAIHGLLTSWAGTGGGGMVVPSCGLAGQTFGKHFLGEHLSDVEEKVFDIGQGSTPGGPLGPIELIDEIFGDPFDVRTHFVYKRTPLFLVCHLPFLSQLVSKTNTLFPQIDYGSADAAANHVVRPFW